MAHTKKYISSATTPAKEIVAVQSEKVGHYENDLFFVKKTQKAKAKLKATSLPAALSKKSK